MGGMPVYGAHSNGPIQPSTMAVVTNGGGNRFSVENYLPSAAPPVQHPIRYTPSDLNLSELLHEKPREDPRQWLGPPIRPEPSNHYVYATNPGAMAPGDLNHRLNR